MRVLITGASGFIGSRLASALLARGSLTAADGSAAPLRQLVLLDRVAAVSNADIDSADVNPRVSIVQGDAADPAVLARIFADPVDAVFALGATLTVEAEADYAHGLQVNLQGMLHLLECCRRQAVAPRLIYTSSIAAFGGPLPDTVDDHVALTPQTSYGTHKAMVELLINDGSRRGFIDGRVLRLPIVVVRPVPAGGSISDRVASLVREPLRGMDVECPLAPETRMPLASVQAVVRALIAVHDLPATGFAFTRVMNLPSLSVTAQELVQAVRTIGQWRTSWTRPLGRISWALDPAMQSVVAAWPQRFDSQRARALGILGDTTLAELIGNFIDETARPRGRLTPT